MNGKSLIKNLLHQCKYTVSSPSDSSNVHRYVGQFYRWLIIALITANLYYCAPSVIHHLTAESQSIHEEFWKSNSFIYDHLMKKTEYQTPIFHFQSQREGPAVLIIGGTHGNEPAGFEATHRLLKQLAHTELKSGEIFIIPEANKLAVLKKSRRIPVPSGIDRERGNLNRCYPGDSTGLPMEKQAYEITQLIRNKKIALLLDLHESPYFHLEMKDKGDQYHGLGQTLIYTPDEEGTWLGMVVLDRMNDEIPADLKQFSLVERPVEHSAAWAAGKYFGIPAFTVETCKKLPLEERIQYQLQIIHIILKEKGII